MMAVTIFGQAKPTAEVDVTKCWAYTLNNQNGEAVATDGSRVVLGLGSGKVEALSFDGNKMWATELGGDIRSNIVSIDSGVFLVTSVTGDDGKSGVSVLRNLSKETGITTWKLNLPGAEGHFLASYNGTIVIVSKNGTIQSVDAKAGTVKWNRQIADGFASAPAFDGGNVIVATTVKQIFAVSLVSGEIISMRKAPFGITALGESDSGQVIAGDERGNVTSFVAGAENAYWSFKSGGEISAVFPIADHVLITSHDNFVYFLFNRNGGVMWKKRLPGRISQIGLYADKFALVTSFEQHGAVLTDLTNGKVAGQIAFGEEERLVSAPVMSNERIFILTDKAVYAFSVNGCAINKRGGPGK